MNNYPNDGKYFSNTSQSVGLDGKKIEELKKIKKIRPWNIASLVLTIIASILAIVAIALITPSFSNITSDSSSVDSSTTLVAAGIIIALYVPAGLLYFARIIIYIFTVVYVSKYNESDLLVWSILALVLGPIFEIVYLVKSKNEIQKNEQLLN